MNVIQPSDRPGHFRDSVFAQFSLFLNTLDYYYLSFAVLEIVASLHFPVGKMGIILQLCLLSWIIDHILLKLSLKES